MPATTPAKTRAELEHCGLTGKIAHKVRRPCPWGPCTPRIPPRAAGWTPSRGQRRRVSEARGGSPTSVAVGSNAEAAGVIAPARISSA